MNYLTDAAFTNGQNMRHHNKDLKKARHGKDGVATTL